MDPNFSAWLQLLAEGYDRDGADTSSLSLWVLHPETKRGAIPWRCSNPNDAVAMLDWGLETPFMSQDRPPLAIAMAATVDGTRGLRRYRLVVVQKGKPRLSPEVATALASRAADHRLTASGFFHAPLIESSYMVMLRMATDHPCGSVLPMMESQCLSIGSAAQYTTFIRYF